MKSEIWIIVFLIIIGVSLGLGVVAFIDNQSQDERLGKEEIQTKTLYSMNEAQEVFMLKSMDEWSKGIVIDLYTIMDSVLSLRVVMYHSLDSLREENRNLTEAVMQLQNENRILGGK